MKRKIIRIFAIILLLTAFTVMGYPYFMQYTYAKNVESELDSFIARVSDNADLMDALYWKLDAENKRIYADGQKDLKDPFSYAETAIDLSEYGIMDGIIAYISVPSMDISLPIYLGASEENMKLGAAHMTQTSYPIGGDNTNTVIPAHRGYSKAAMFRDIEKVSIGDPVYIHGIKGTLTYKVVETKIIIPTEVDKVLIQTGRDMVTMFTCHPYRQNKQRYVVYCERVS